MPLHCATHWHSVTLRLKSIRKVALLATIRYEYFLESIRVDRPIVLLLQMATINSQHCANQKLTYIFY